jgi:putative copper export protein
MPTIIHWIHLIAAVFSVGGLAFILFVVIPSLKVLDPEDRELISRRIMYRFLWLNLAATFLLFVSGLYGIRQFYWEVAWGWSWVLLTVKIVLALIVFIISLALTLRIKILDRIRAQQQTWLTIALGLGMAIIFIAAYLRRG